MMRLEDRMRIALGAGMGIEVAAGEVETFSRMLVALRKIATDDPTLARAKSLAAEAIRPFED